MFGRVIAAALLAAAPLGASAKVVPVPGPDVPIAEARKFFTEDPDAPAFAPQGYDVTIVEYLDYQCPACRTTLPALKALMAKDPKVRVIFRDWPVFGPESEKAARLAVASHYQGKYLAFHEALLTTPRPLTDEKIRAAAKRAGVDWDRLLKDRKAHADDIEDLIDRNDLQANMLGLEGTPGFIIGDSQSFGALTLKQLEESVADARRKGKKAARE